MVLTELRSYCEQHNIPIISKNTESFITHIVQSHQPKSCLEIGSAVGYSSIFIAQQISKRKGKLTGFEIAHNSYTRSLQNTKEYHNLQIYPFDYTKIPTDLLRSHIYDFVFIDAQKSHYKLYIQKALENINKESVIVLDDVIKFQNKLETLYGYLNKLQIFYKILKIDDDDGLMIVGNPDKISGLLSKYTSKQQ